MENLKSQIKFIHEMEAKEIIEEAEEKTKKIVNEAEEEAKKIRDTKMLEASGKLEEKEASELATVRLEAKKRILNIKSQLVEEALAKAMDKLKEIVSDNKPLYKKSFEKLVIEATSKLKGSEFQILTNSTDKKLVEESLREFEKEISKSKDAAVRLQLGGETLDALGGVMVTTKDRRQIFNNTLEARLAYVRQEMADKIFDSLFEGLED